MAYKPSVSTRNGVVSFRLISFRYRRQSGLGSGSGLGLRLGEMRPNHPEYKFYHLPNKVGLPDIHLAIFRC